MRKYVIAAFIGALIFLLLFGIFAQLHGWFIASIKVGDLDYNQFSNIQAGLKDPLRDRWVQLFVLKRFLDYGLIVVIAGTASGVGSIWLWNTSITAIKRGGICQTAKPSE